VAPVVEHVSGHICDTDISLPSHGGDRKAFVVMTSS